MADLGSHSGGVYRVENVMQSQLFFAKGLAHYMMVTVKVDCSPSLMSRSVSHFDYKP